jgi:hypothetical protein
MGITNTIFALLKKQAFGDKGWHTAVNDSLDMVDRFIAGRGYGDPNIDLTITGLGVVRTKITGEHIGQTWYRIDNGVFYRCVATGVPPAGIWEREVPRGAGMPYFGDIVNIPRGWALCNGVAVNLLYSGGQTIETITPPNARGRYLVTFDDSLVDVDYDVLSELLAFGGKKFTVTEANIAQFATASNGDHSHTQEIIVGGVGLHGGSAFQAGNAATSTNGAHTHNIGKTGLDLIELDNRPPSIVAALLYRL